MIWERMNWTEKYRPKRIAEVIGQNKFVADATQWVNRKEMPNVLIYGQQGNGKTTAAHCLANEILGESKPLNFIEINASQDRRLDTIRTTITNFANTKGTDDVPFKICFLDEFDGMTKDSQRALKRTMERATNVRFIITCNDVHSIEHPIRSRCANYWFEPLDILTMNKMLLFICEQEDINPDAMLEDILNLCVSVNGDMRRAINELQASAYSGISLEEKTKDFMKNYSMVLDLLNEQELSKANDILMDEVLKGRSVIEICNNLHHCVLETNMNRSTMFKCLSHIGEMEWRSKSMTPKIIVSWFVAQFIDLQKTKKESEKNE